MYRTPKLSLTLDVCKQPVTQCAFLESVSKQKPKYAIKYQNNDCTSLESTAAYMMSIQPLNVAFQKIHMNKYVCIN